MATAFLLWLFLQSASHPPENELDRLRSRVAVEAVVGSPTELAGVYVNPPKELRGAVDRIGLTTALYLFPDETYIYVQRGSLIPLTIFDKGSWAIVSESLQLKSAGDVRWNPDLERRFLLVRRSSHPEEVLLVGAQMAVNRFEKLASNDSDTALLAISKQRRGPITNEHATSLKNYLIKTGWHPERFGDVPSTAFLSRANFAAISERGPG
jgi:hypothetical protein